jgi:transcriptional regulatory protein RtcR
MQKKKRVVIGFIGTKLDAGAKPGRWDRWRPTVGLTKHAEFPVDRLDLLFNGPVHGLVASTEKDISVVSPGTQVVPHELPISESWEYASVYAALYQFAKTYPFDLEKEEYLVHITTGSNVAQICLFLLVKAGYIPGRILQTAPPVRQGDPARYQVIDLDLSKYDALAENFSIERERAQDFLKSGIATLNAGFNKLIEEVESVAIRSTAPMLLMGPTGAGKSFLAKRIHQLKKATHQVVGKFIDVNCATLQGDAAGSSLFGHVKGAFTGAMSEREGLLRTANGGTLFLDEIGELSLDAQAMLLTAIEEKRFYPMGSDVEVKCKFQLIAGTNKDLAQEVIAGRFREDLYARINLWTYVLPSLSERQEDIAPNIDFLLDRFADEHTQNTRFNKEAKDDFLRFATSSDALWIGNFRDLSAAITRMATLSPSGRITQDTVQAEITRLRRLWKPYDKTAPLHGTYVDLAVLVDAETLAGIDLFDLPQLKLVVAICQQSNSLSDAGRKLFAVSRAAKEKPNDADRLKKYLAKFGLTWASFSR